MFRCAAGDRPHVEDPFGISDDLVPQLGGHELRRESRDRPFGVARHSKRSGRLVSHRQFGSMAECRETEAIRQWIVEPGCDRLAAIGQRDDDAEGLVAGCEIGGSVQWVDDPDLALAESLEKRRIRRARFLADNARRREYVGQSLGEDLLRLTVGHRHPLTGRLLCNVRLTELPEARKDRIRGGLSDQGRNGIAKFPCRASIHQAATRPAATGERRM